MFDQVEEALENVPRRSLAVAACFLSAACAASLARPTPFHRRLTLVETIIWSCAYVALVFAVPALIAWLRNVRPSGGLAAYACWLAPLTLFVTQGHWWSVLIVVSRIVRESLGNQLL